MVTVGALVVVGSSSWMPIDVGVQIDRATCITE